MIELLVMTDGRREHIGDTIRSAGDNLVGPIERRWIHDDSGDRDHRAWLEEQFPGWLVIGHPAGRQGFGGAISNAWRHLQAAGAAPFVFHLEDDFTFNRPVDLVSMVEVLKRRPYLVQLALRRQPWNVAEIEAGGIVEQYPDDYVETRLEDGAPGPAWLEHRRFFTTNPSLYRRELMARGWPAGAHSEGRFGVELVAEDPDARFAYWGSRDSGEWVRHNGHTRNGTGY